MSGSATYWTYSSNALENMNCSQISRTIEDMQEFAEEHPENMQHQHELDLCWLQKAYQDKSEANMAAHVKLVQEEGENVFDYRTQAAMSM